VKPVLVTGASGFVGWHVARLLLEKGCSVRALLRAGRVAPGLEVEPLAGDLRDPESLRAAVAGCGVVYHVAADYRLWARDKEELFRSNAGGTRNLLEAAALGGVERVVYTSTVGCIGIPMNGIGSEDNPVRYEDMTGAYKQSKFRAEEEALAAAHRGLPVVIVNPTAPVGDHDFKPTPTGGIILDFLQGRLPAFVDTGLNLVDVRDVALGHLQACESGRAGERYILGGENLTLKEILARLARHSGLRAPNWEMPYWAAYAAGALSTGWAGLTGRPPRVALDGVRMARKKMFVTHAKAEKELGYRPGPVDEALARAVRWFRDNGYC